MAQFYRALFERKLLTKRLKLEPAQAGSLETLLSAISKYSKQYDPRNPLAIYRLPQAELKAIAAMPCSDPKSPVILLSSKELRSQLKVKESTACMNCKFLDSCAHKYKLPSEIKTSNKQSNNLQDVFNVLAGLYKADDSELTIGFSQAAGTTATMLSDTLADFEENDGLEFKILLNELKQES